MTESSGARTTIFVKVAPCPIQAPGLKVPCGARIREVPQQTAGGWDIKKMYPSITPALIVATIDTHLLSLINTHPQDSGNLKAAKNFRQMMIPLISFLLEHAFIYIQQGDLKTFSRFQKTGPAYTTVCVCVCVCVFVC